MLFSTLIAPMLVLAQGPGQGTHFYISPLGRSALKFGHGTAAQLTQGQCGITNIKSTPVQVTMKNGKLPISFTKVKSGDNFKVEVRLQISIQTPTLFPNFAQPPVIRAVTLKPGVASADVSLDVRSFMSDKLSTYAWVQIVAYKDGNAPTEKHCYPVYLIK